jgi:hypothetical protein
LLQGVVGLGDNYKWYLVSCNELLVAGRVLGAARSHAWPSHSSHPQVRKMIHNPVAKTPLPTLLARSVGDKAKIAMLTDLLDKVIRAL